MWVVEGGAREASTPSESRGGEDARKKAKKKKKQGENKGKDGHRPYRFIWKA